MVPPMLDRLELAGLDNVAVEEVTGPADPDAEEVVASLELD